MAYRQKGFSPFTVGKEELERRRKKKLKEQQDLQDKIDKFNQQETYGVDGDALKEQIKSYEITKKPGPVSSVRQLTKTERTDGGSKISKSDDFIVRTGKSDFKKGKFHSKDLRGRGPSKTIARKVNLFTKNLAIAKDFQGKRPVDETQQGRTFYDRGDKGAEGRFASSEKARIGYQSKAELNPQLKFLKSKLFKRSKIKGTTLKEVDPNQNYKESYMQSSGKRKTTKKTRREKGSLNLKRDKVKFTRSRTYGKNFDFGTKDTPGDEGKKWTQGYVRKTGEGFLGLQNRKTYVDGKLYTKPKSKLFSKTKIKPPKQKKVKTTKSDKPFASMEAITVTPKMQSKRDRKATRASNKANRQQKRADRKKKLLAAANMKSMRNFEEKFN